MRTLVTTTLCALTMVSLAVPARGADIVDTAVSAGNFKTLAAALGAADLVKTLKGKGPFTVFAPTDEAFAKLPKGTVETLLKPENKAALAGVLTYHVVPGRVTADQVVNLKGAVTVNGQRVGIEVRGSTVMLNDSKVVTTDIACDNGVIHVIDSVLLPADKNLAETATSAGTFKTLVAAAKAAGLVDALTGKDALTVFAPTDDAFAKLPKGTVESLLKPENKQKLVDILTYHVVAGRVYSEAAVKLDSAKTLGGSSIKIRATEKGAFINDAKLLKTDIDASNGVIHVIDSVLMPPAKNADARQTLQHAVAKGAPLFNAGHHQACAEVYASALQGMVHVTSDASMRHQMETVLTAARQQHCPTQRAWTLRHAIDKMYTQLAAVH